jgi:ATP synthase I chain
VQIQERILKFITRTNWILFALASLAGFVFLSAPFAKGILFGGLIVTINFHLLSRTLKKSLKPPHLASPNTILAKYYIRFLISGVIIFFLIVGDHVHPIGLFIGLSVVVASIMLATLCEVKKLIFKEAV